MNFTLQADAVSNEKVNLPEINQNAQVGNDRRPIL